MGAIKSHGIPHTIVDFDRINDVDYLFAILKPAFSVRYVAEFTDSRFRVAHAEVKEYRNTVRDGF